MRDRIDHMVDTVARFPLASIVVPARFAPGLSAAELDAHEREHGVRLGAALRGFYAATDGFTFFWRLPGGDVQALIDRYNEVVPDPTTRIEWEMTHGIAIPPLAQLFTDRSFGDLFLTPRDEATMQAWAGRALTAERAAAAVRVFDRFLTHNNEDACIGLLLQPDEDPRVVGVTDSGMVDPKRPWMSVTTYLDLIITMGGEYGSRYDLMDFATLPSGEITFTPEQIERFGRDIFRPI